MSIAFSGCRSRSAGVISAIAKEIRRINLVPCKKITVQFDPFGENVHETRCFLYYISSPKISYTNPFCELKTNIICDRSEPIVKFNLGSGETILFKSKNLTAVDILKLYNKRVTDKIPKDAAVLAAEQELLSKKRKKKYPKSIKPGSKKRGVEIYS